MDQKGKAQKSFNTIKRLSERARTAESCPSSSFRASPVLKEADDTSQYSVDRRSPINPAVIEEAWVQRVTYPFGALSIQEKPGAFGHDMSVGTMNKP